MNTTYEYVFAVLIVALILGFSVLSINSIIETQIQPLKQEQLRPITERLFDKILLSKGYPYDWGANIFVSYNPDFDPNLNLTLLEDMGLAANSTNLYTMDVNKIMRLVENVGSIENSLYIPPEYFGNLTGINEDGHWNYGFRLLIKNALNITISTRSSTQIRGEELPISFDIAVSTYSRKVAANSVVNARLFCMWVDRQAETFDYFYSSLQNKTNFEGKTVLSFDKDSAFWAKINALKGSISLSFFLFTTANYYGLQSQAVQTYPQMPTLDLMLQGKYLISSFIPGVKFPKSAHHLGAHSDIVVIEFTEEEEIILNPAINGTGHGEADRVINQGGKNYRLYELSQNPSPEILFAGIMVTTRGRDWFCFASRPIVPTAIDYRSHTFAQAGIKSEVLSRIVRIGLNSYYAELTVWRMSE